jgi:hypothetical protein
MIDREKNMHSEDPYNGPIKGTLTVTNYKLFFKSSERVIYLLMLN